MFRLSWPARSATLLADLQIEQGEFHAFDGEMALQSAPLQTDLAIQPFHTRIAEEDAALTEVDPPPPADQNRRRGW